MSYTEINAMRKEGNLSQALTMAESEFALHPDKHSAVALFWCLNSLRKETDLIDQSNAIIERMTALCLQYAPDNAALLKTIEVARQSLTPEAMSERKAWRVFKAAKEAPTLAEQTSLLNEYLTMDNPRPSMLHSLVLNEAIKIANDYPDGLSICSFAEAWQLEHLRPEDWDKPATKSGYPATSTIERLLSAISHELVRKGQAPSPTFSMLLQQALEQYPQNKQLVRNEAQFMALKGDKVGAADIYRDLLVQQPSAFYLWEDLSDLVDDPVVHAGMLCAALSCNAPDDYLPSIRLKLARDLIEMGLYDNALTELEMAADTYARNNWPMPQSMSELRAQIPSDANTTYNSALYAKYKACADQYLYANADKAILIKLKDVKNPRNSADLTWQMRGENGMVWIDPRKFRLDPRTPKGTIFAAHMLNDEVVSIAPTYDISNQPWIRKVEGYLIIKSSANGKRFGFVDSVFVTGTMLGSLRNGDYVSLLAVLNPDGRWGAIVIY